MSDDIKEAVKRKGDASTFLQAISAVLWSFFGVRRGKDQARDMEKLNPIHVIIVGIGAAALFVLGLLLIVSWIVGSA